MLEFAGSVKLSLRTASHGGTKRQIFARIRVYRAPVMESPDKIYDLTSDAAPPINLRN